jgi:Fe-S-cluster-containing dehydrogenase component
MQKRPADGIVFVDDSLCVGCKTCITACPWGSPQWNADTGKVVKCDYCKDRIDEGLEPACVAKCVTKCLHFGKATDMGHIKRERYAQVVAAFE